MPSFVDEAESDLRWREDELAALKMLAVSSQPRSVKHRALLRALVALLYAHYEGFCKVCWELFLDEVARRKPARSSLLDDIRVASLEHRVKEIRRAPHVTGVLALVESHEEFCGAYSDLAIDTSTESNLWPDRFNAVMQRLGLSSEQMANYNVEMKALVGRRNGIAHGERLVVSDIAQYDKLENCAFLVMHEVALLLADSLEQEGYLKPRERSRQLALFAERAH